MIEGLTTRADSAEACAKLALAHLGGGTSNAVMHNIAMECVLNPPSHKPALSALPRSHPNVCRAPPHFHPLHLLKFPMRICSFPWVWYPIPLLPRRSDESSDMTSAAYLAVRGKAAAVDAARVWVSSGRARPLVLSAMWGLSSDVDQESERIRCCCPCALQPSLTWPPPHTSTISSLLSPPSLFPCIRRAVRL